MLAVLFALPSQAPEASQASESSSGCPSGCSIKVAVRSQECEACAARRGLLLDLNAGSGLDAQTKMKC